MGPEVIFIVPIHLSKKCLYIASKHVDFYDLEQLTPELTNFKSLAMLDLVSRIFFLNDTTLNSENCGQQMDEKESPIFVDFRYLSYSYV